MARRRLHLRCSPAPVIKSMWVVRASLPPTRTASLRLVVSMVVAIAVVTGGQAQVAARLIFAWAAMRWRSGCSSPAAAVAPVLPVAQFWGAMAALGVASAVLRVLPAVLVIPVVREVLRIRVDKSAAALVLVVLGGPAPPAVAVAAVVILVVVGAVLTVAVAVVAVVAATARLALRSKPVCVRAMGW